MTQKMIEEIAEWILHDAGDWGEVYRDTEGKRVFTFGNESLMELYEDEGLTEYEITKNAESIIEACKKHFLWNYNWTESVTYDWRIGFKVVMEGDDE